MNEKPRVVPRLNSHDVPVSGDTSTTLLTIADAATRLGCSERFIRRLVQERRIPFVRLGGSLIRFELADLEQWIAGQRVAAMGK